ncbi:MAG: MraY family glycosyltransferase [Armatimonadota bacterium]|nr:MraY family glycosyltransferase [Armatimonadota bacterium]MDR7443997.1 MraY family glycosyltransferase [Armatimonadota bacterium]MDR7570973.1 MraY family glycosyltransferase [Armatimonadota bacterium]MDR7615400.1 MraY family glycosyltransferase [Armatimonadota bacterium]
MFIPPYVVSAVVAWFVTYWTTPTARWIARRTGAVDYPGGRRINRRPLPRLGGVALFCGIFLSALLTLPLPGPIALVREPKHFVLAIPYGPVDGRLLGVVLGAVAITALGVVDDLRQLPGRTKFPLIYLAAAIPVLFGVTTPFLTNPLTGKLVPLGVLGQLFTVAWVGSAAIAMNSIDGVDGLAAGIAAIVAATFFAAATALRSGPGIPVLCAAVVGSCVGFLRYNFNPARVIMGDGGALLLGYLLGAISVVGMFKTLTVISLAVPLVAMGIPILDTALAIVRRVRKGVPVFQPDREHLHHRLLDRGLSQRQTVFLLYGLSALLAVLALWIAGSVRPEISVLLALVLGGSLWVSAWRLGLLHRTPTRGSEVSRT